MDAKGREELQALVDTYELHAMEWEVRADELVAYANRDGWNDKLTETVEDFRHKAAKCRDLAQEVRDS